MTNKLLYVMAIAALVSSEAAAQVQTEIPPAVPGAKPVAAEHIKIHGKALESNLEGNAVDRDVFVFFTAQLCEREIPPLPGRLRFARLFDRGRAMDS